MPSWLERLFEDIRNLWQKLPSSQQWLVGGLAGALVLSLIAISLTMFLLPSGQFFMGELSTSQMGDVAGFLDERNVRYDVGEDGKSLYVFQDPKKLQFEYASARGTKTLGGNSILLGPNWSQTKEQFDETRLRALQEELETTIEKADNIAWARVHLTKRERGLFPSGDTRAAASVSIKTHSGTPSRNEVEAIQWLVANSLPGLEPANVKVVGNGNRVLEGYTETTESEQVANEQRKAERELEVKKNERIAAILDPIVGGPQNYTSSVILNLDYDKLQIEETVLDTEAPLAVRIKTEESSEETSQAGGVPGTPENNPADRLGRNVEGGSTSQTTEERNERDFRPRLEKKINRVVAPGAILSQHVSIAINQREILDGGTVTYQPRTPEELATLERQLKAAVGHIDASPEYQFVLSEIAFDNTSAVIAETSEKRDLLFRQLESATFLIFAVVLIAVFFYFLRKVFVESAEEELVEEEVELPPSQLSLHELGLRDLTDSASLAPEDQKNKMLREQVEKFALEAPEATAQIVRNWLSE